MPRLAAIAGALLWLLPAAASAQQSKPPTAAECIDSFENAQRAQKNGHMVFAHKLYGECVVNACPKQVRHDCVQGQADAEKAIATVTVVVRDAAGADVPATIKVDGNPFTPEPGRAVPIDPGPREFQYTVNGESKTMSVTIVEGEKSRVIVLPAPAPETPAPPPAQPAPPPSPAPSGSPLIGPIIVGSVGVLLLAGFIGMYAMASSEADDRDIQSRLAIDPSRSQNERAAAVSAANSHNDAANNDQRLAYVCGVGSLLFLAGGATWYLLGRQPKAAQIAPIVAPGHAGTSLSLSF